MEQTFLVILYTSNFNWIYKSTQNSPLKDNKGVSYFGRLDNWTINPQSLHDQVTCERRHPVYFTINVILDSSARQSSSLEKTLGIAYINSGAIIVDSRCVCVFCLLEWNCKKALLTTTKTLRKMVNVRWNEDDLIKVACHTDDYLHLEPIKVRSEV